ncbi:MAG TPA: hypothetical protein VNT26_11675, partial [Candidatus Sulfotelmatobacter sp.]|nr:hypothetical protein [Candidatus Sulfotelmatobacter sp.]
MASRSLVLLSHKPTLAPDQSVRVLRVNWQALYVELEVPGFEPELSLLRIPAPPASRDLRQKPNQISIL